MTRLLRSFESSELNTEIKKPADSPQMLTSPPLSATIREREESFFKNKPGMGPTRIDVRSSKQAKKFDKVRVSPSSYPTLTPDLQKSLQKSKAASTSTSSTTSTTSVVSTKSEAISSETTTAHASLKIQTRPRRGNGGGFEFTKFAIAQLAAKMKDGAVTDSLSQASSTITPAASVT